MPQSKSGERNARRDAGDKWQQRRQNSSPEKKAEAFFAKSMRAGMLSKSDAWFALMATILKTTQHPMAATTVTENEWNHVTSPVLWQGLPCVGLDCDFP
jgi:hypothetical protein